MLLLQVIFKQLFLWLHWDLIMSLQRSRAMRCSSSPIWCLRYMERCRISPLHLCPQMSFDADIVLMFWLDLFPGQLYCGGGESKAKVWTAGERENGEHQIGDLIKSILDWIGVTNVTFRMIQRHTVFFWRGGNPILSYMGFYPQVLPQMSRDYFMCDPQVQEEGEDIIIRTSLLSSLSIS